MQEYLCSTKNTKCSTFQNSADYSFEEDGREANACEHADRRDGCTAARSAGTAAIRQGALRLA